MLRNGLVGWQRQDGSTTVNAIGSAGRVDDNNGNSGDADERVRMDASLRERSDSMLCNSWALGRL